MSKNNKTGQRTRRQSKPTIIIVERHYEDNENNEKTETVWFHFSPDGAAEKVFKGIMDVFSRLNVKLSMARIT